MASAHNRLVEMLGPGLLVQMDDDVRAIEQRVSPTKLAPVRDLPELFDLGFRLCAKTGSTLWGVYPVHNPFYMERRVRTDLAFCIGQCFGQILSGRACERTTLDVKNDYERTLAHFMCDGAVTRMDWVCADSPVYSGSGGLQDINRAELAEDAIVTLQSRFPGLVRRKPSKRPDRPEITLVQPSVERARGAPRANRVDTPVNVVDARAQTTSGATAGAASSEPLEGA